MGTLIFGVLLALTLFWGVGAHNRLMRLRSVVRDQWVVVDAAWIKLLVPLQGSLAARLVQDGDTAHDVALEVALDAPALAQACEQLLDALTQARQQPLDASRVQGVLQARRALMDKIVGILARDKGQAWPELVSLQLRLWQNLPALVGQYHQAVEVYHEAIETRPARWLAQRLGLTHVQRLDEMVVGLELGA